MIQYTLSDGICLLRLDAPPVNAITLGLLEALRAAIERANGDPEVRGIVITGGPDHFSAGADIGIFEQIHANDDAIRLARAFQETFQAVEDSPKPVVAAVAGRVMGGALELAMACHLRAARKGSQFSMPEVKLGINPAAGGTQRLPRLVGLPAALKMLLTAEPLGAAEALSLGLVDAVCEGESLVAQARAMAQACDPPRRTGRLAEKIEGAGLREAALGEAEKLLAQSRPEILAPRKIVEAVRAGIEESFGAGLRSEREGFAACVGSPAAQNKFHLFFATRRTAKIAELEGIAPPRVGKAAVVGMGTMGAGIAHALILAGIATVVRDEDDKALDQGKEKIRSSLARRVEQGKLAPPQAEAALERLRLTREWEDLAEADLAIEAVFEEVGLKRSVLGRLEAVCRPGAILASNTSTISLDQLGEGMQRPERLVGMHFFNPAQRMPLVEVIRATATSPAAIAAVIQLARTLGKTPVLVRNREGFLVNRVFIPYLKEAFWLLEEGAEPEAIDRAMATFGFPMGPLALIDMAGLDILVLTDRVMRAALPRHGDLPAVATRLADRRQLGQKTGGGVYRYEEGSHTPLRSEIAETVLAEVRRERGIEPRPIGSDEITRRLVLRMIGEAFYVLEEGIAQRPSDLDVAMVLGTGFPDFRGGVVKYAYDLGLGQVVKELEELAARCGERFQPSRYLRQQAVKS